MSYIDSLSSVQKNNSAFIVKAAVDSGITNRFAIAAILAIISKESEFIPKSENLSYSVKRIKEVFPSLGNKAEQLGKNPQGLGDAIYGGRYGNANNEGYKYRGRGYNQLTFKGNYDKFGKIIKVDLVKNPDLANDPQIAAKIAIAFFLDGINDLKKKGKLDEYNATSINDFNNLTDSILAIYHVNSGTGNKVSKIKNLQNSDTLGGFTKAMERVNGIYTNLKDILKQAANVIDQVKTTVGNNSKLLPILLTGLVIAGYFISKKLQKA